MEKISFVIPCYRSANTLPLVVQEIQEAMESLQQYTYEIVMVNDSSPDETFQVIQKLVSAHTNMIGVNLAKNFGQHAALMAGFRQAGGELVVCLDDDGQTPANEVGKLLAAIEQGADVVYASYEEKRHSPFRRFGSYINDVMTRVMLGKPKELKVTSYFAARQFVVKEMLRYENAYPYVIGLVLRSTKNIVNVPVTHRERQEGTSGYTLTKLMGLWMNGFTAFSIKPLRIASIVGCICAGGSFLYGIYTIIKKFVNPEVPIGFSALITAILFVGGMLMLMLGLIGEYIGRMYISMNASPQYVVREIIGKECESRGGQSFE